MALTSDQKKHLLIGGGIGALALAAGYALLGGRKAYAAALPPGAHGKHHDHHRKHAHEDQGQGEEARENDRGEYGHKKHKHHHGGHGRG